MARKTNETVYRNETGICATLPKLVCDECDGGKFNFAAWIEQLINTMMVYFESVFVKALPYERTGDRVAYLNGLHKPKKFIIPGLGISLKVTTHKLRGLTTGAKIPDSCYTFRNLIASFSTVSVESLIKMRELALSLSQIKSVSEIFGKMTSIGSVSTKTTAEIEWDFIEINKDKYMFVDKAKYNVKALYLDSQVNSVHRNNEKHTVIHAGGLRQNGEYVILGFYITSSENADDITKFLKEVKKNLKFKPVIAVCDDNKATKSAIRNVYPNTRIMNCMAHTHRLMRVKIIKCNRDGERLYTQFKTMYSELLESSSIKKAKKRYAEIAKFLLENKLGAAHKYWVSLGKETYNCVVIRDKKTRKLVYTNNPIESYHAGISRRKNSSCHANIKTFMNHELCCMQSYHNKSGNIHKHRDFVLSFA